jgi:hypothetical protein
MTLLGSPLWDSSGKVSRHVSFGLVRHLFEVCVCCLLNGIEERLRRLGMQGI